MATHKRSIAKAITFRIVATLTTVGLVFLVTGSFAMAGAIGFMDTVVKLGLYYVHERAWLKVKWGRKPVQA